MNNRLLQQLLEEVMNDGIGPVMTRTHSYLCRLQRELNIEFKL